MLPLKLRVLPHQPVLMLVSSLCQEVKVGALEARKGKLTLLPILHARISIFGAHAKTELDSHAGAVVEDLGGEDAPG